MIRYVYSVPRLSQSHLLNQKLCSDAEGYYSKFLNLDSNAYIHRYNNCILKLKIILYCCSCASC